MQGTPEQLQGEIWPNGTKLKLIQCVEGAPAPVCKTKKKCSKGMKRVGKCLRTGDNCEDVTKWYKKKGNEDEAIP
jgi:hypothetical protein